MKPVTKKAKKIVRLTLRQAKLEAARLGLQVNPLYDRRFINTWLYTIGVKDVEPVEKRQIVHVAKPKVTLKLSDLIEAAQSRKQ